MNAPATPYSPWRRLLNQWHRFFASDLERLSGTIEEFRIEKAHRAQPDAAWSRRADAYLAQAEIERDAGRVNPGWTSLKAAQRELIEAYEVPELEVEAERLKLEANAKLGKGWRADAISAALDPVIRLRDQAQFRKAVATALEASPADAGVSAYQGLRTRVALTLAASVDRPEAADRDDLRIRVKEARRILDDHHGNVYKKIDILRRHVLWAGAVLLVLLVAMLTFASTTAESISAAHLLSNRQALLVTMILGAVGAAVSGVLAPLSSDRSQRIPDIGAQSYLVWVRPIIGAGAAVVVVAILRSDLGGVTVDDRLLPVAALAAGFSERVVGQSVAVASAALSK